MSSQQVHTYWIAVLVLGVHSLSSQACVDPGDPPNSLRVIQGDFSEGGNVTYFCVSGYVLHTGEQEYTRTCTAAGWTGTSAACNKITCPEPVDMLHANKTGGYTFGDYVTYTCDPGYKFDGGEGGSTLTLRCSANGTWDGDMDTCEPLKCIEPEQVPFANITLPPGPYFFGSSISFTCTDGYYLAEGDLVMTCGVNRFWEEQWPVCDKVKCVPLGHIDHASQKVSGLGLGANISYTCNYGYEWDPGSGPLERLCQENGSWTGQMQPICRGVYCGDPAFIANSSMSPDPASYRHPETVIFQCEEGFKPKTNSTHTTQIRCEKTGNWNFQPATCKRVQCLEYSAPSNTKIDNTKYNYEDVKVLECKDGYVIQNGSLSRLCQSNGSWTDEVPQCTRKSCGDLRPLPHADFLDGTGDLHYFGDVSSYECHPGYEIEGEVMTKHMSIVCQASGNYQPAYKSCVRVNCRNPSQGRKVIVDSTDGTLFGDEVAFSCEFGFEPEKGSFRRICQANSTWSGSMPVCIEQACVPPPSVANARLIGTRFRANSSVYYSCDEGYNHISGDNKLTCTLNGWIGTPPVCQIVPCGSPDKIRDADVIVSNVNGIEVAAPDWLSKGITNVTANEDVMAQGFHYGDRVNYSCQIGHEWDTDSGDLSRTCNKYGKWSNLRPNCAKISCGDPGAIAGMSKIGFTYTYLSIVNYTCAAGYEVQAGKAWSIMECTSDRKWIGKPPKCKKLSCGDPGHTKHTVRDRETFLYNDVLHYRCEDGYYIKDWRTKLKCTMTRKWNYPVPNCTVLPVIEVTDHPGKDTGPAEEAEDAKKYGAIGIAMLAFELGTCIILDLITLPRSIPFLKRNLGIKVKKEQKPPKKQKKKPLTEEEEQVERGRREAERYERELLFHLEMRKKLLHAWI